MNELLFRVGFVSRVAAYLEEQLFAVSSLVPCDHGTSDCINREKKVKRYKTIAIIAAMAVVLTMITGCGKKDDSPEGLFKQVIASMNDLADQFESIEDAASADKAAAVIERDIIPRLSSAMEKLKALEKDMGEEALEEMAKQFEEDGEKAAEKMFSQLMRVAMNEELMTPALEKAMEEFEKAMESFDD